MVHPPIRLLVNMIGDWKKGGRSLPINILWTSRLAWNQWLKTESSSWIAALGIKSIQWCHGLCSNSNFLINHIRMLFTSVYIFIVPILSTLILHVQVLLLHINCFNSSYFTHLLYSFHYLSPERSQKGALLYLCKRAIKCFHPFGVMKECGPRCFASPSFAAQTHTQTHPHPPVWVLVPSPRGEQQALEVMMGPAGGPISVLIMSVAFNCRWNTNICSLL